MPRNPVNIESRLLSAQENESIFNGLGQRCYTLGTTLAELYQTEGKDTDSWKVVCSGVVCYVKDFIRRSYFIRVYDRQSKELVWEHDIRTKNSSPVFSTTTDGLPTITVNEHKLEFADKDEAHKFQAALEDRLSTIARRRRVLQGLRPPPPPNWTGKGTKSDPTVSKKKKKTKVALCDISVPTSFKHVNRVEYDPSTGFNTQKLEPEMRTLFEKIGIDDPSTVDRETMEFIYDFIDKHGGPEAASNPKRGSSTSKSGPTIGPPPPPPNRKLVPQPPPPSRTSRPPPPPQIRSAGPPLPPEFQQNNNKGPPTHPTSRRVGPPLPPPNKSMFPPPPPPNRIVGIPATQQNRSTGPPPPPQNRSFDHQSDLQNPGSNPTFPPREETNGATPASLANQGHALNVLVKADTPSSSTQPPPSLTNREEASNDNPLKQQIMQLFMQNPSEMTDVIYNLLIQQGGIRDIRASSATRNSQSEPQPPSHGTQQHHHGDDQASGGTNPHNTSDGATGMTYDDEVPGRMESGCIDGGQSTWTSECDFGSDMLDDDEDWDD